MDNQAIQEPTSLKEAIQGLAPEPVGVIQGIVISDAPIKIKALNDDKLIIEKNIMCLPRHLTDYTAECDITLGSGTIDSQTLLDGGHSHPDAGTGGLHVNQLETFNVYRAIIKMYNALQVGDLVYMLSFNHGKKYYILDREEQQ